METGDIKKSQWWTLNKHWYIRNVIIVIMEPYEPIGNATLAKIICETKRWSTLKVGTYFAW